MNKGYTASAGRTSPDALPEFSVVILAGGKSGRMQSDKAFLEHRGRPFISLIAEEAALVSPDVLVVIGKKDKARFESVLSARVRIANDAYDLGSPLGGMLTAFDVARTKYAAVLACDTPFVRGDVLRFIHESAVSHSAAVPLWESGRVEPLCSVYNVEEAGEATRAAISSGDLSCRSMISLLHDVNYVPVSRLRALDPSLSSLLNLNWPGDLKAFESVEANPLHGAASRGGSGSAQASEEA